MMIRRRYREHVAVLSSFWLQRGEKRSHWPCRRKFGDSASATGSRELSRMR